MSDSNWRAESECVLRSPTKRELQQREGKTGIGILAQRRPRSKAVVAGVVGGIAIVVLVVVLVPVLVTQRAVHGHTHQGPLGVAYCDQLPERPRQLCLQYQQAQGGAKFAAAAQWKQASPATYECAGVDAECLNSDLQSSSGGSVCQVLADGSQCGQSQQWTCQSGFCGGPTATAAAATFYAPDAPAGSDTAASTKAARGDEADDTVPASEIMLFRITAIPAAPNASWPTAVASVWPSKTGIRVPEAFLATSHEWRRIKDYAGDNLKAWSNIFSMLSDSPVIRIGGASQDAMTEVPGPDVWEALVRLQKSTNARYIFGLPLWQKNALEMSKQIMKDAEKYLGDTVIGFELGNEPEFWPTGLGGYDEKGKWVPGFEAFASYFHRTALALNPCSPGKATNKPHLSGPGWGNVNTQDPSWFAKIINQGADCYFWESNTHYYPYINNETVTSQELLSQWLQDFAVDKFKEYVGISKKAGLDIRISETNSMYGGGRVNISETMAGTLWTIDALYAFANAGARAFHLHWGKGGEPNGDAPPSVGVQTNFEFRGPGRPPLPWPSVHAPWYAYLMWTTAAAGGYGQAVDTAFVAANFDKLDTCTANVKVWALKSDDGQVRITLLNKDHDKSCNVEVHLEPKFCSSQATFARLLPGKRGLDSKAGLTWQGQHYVGAGTTGVIQGNMEVEEVEPIVVPGKSCIFKVAMPRISGALLVVDSKDKQPAV